MKGLSQEDIENLLIECGTTPTIWKQDEMMVCCPVHQERNPSCGINSSKQIFHCFSCGASGNFPWMLHKSQPEQYKTYQEAVRYLENNYDINYSIDGKTEDIIRYEDLNFRHFNNVRKELPLYKLAPFMCGKETYRYFYQRGFSKEDVLEYKIGRDLDNRTVVIPVFYEDGVLAGIIGRYIDNRKKNERYKIYNHFQRGKLLYPINKYECDKGVAILVEGQIDALYLRKLGYKNVLAKMGVELTTEQSEWLCNNCECVINIGDNDERGFEGILKDKRILDNRIKVLSVDYPNYGKDPCDWSKKDIDYMIRNAHGNVGKINRYI